MRPVSRYRLSVVHVIGKRRESAIVLFRPFVNFRLKPQAGLLDPIIRFFMCVRIVVAKKILAANGALAVFDVRRDRIPNDAQVVALVRDPAHFGAPGVACADGLNKRPA